ncbi:hypothetical protein ACFSQP_08955 [Bizionia sediminis]|uniref:Uncharacterized protein n=1 Tax=Bizionia sediminis TaxID=1737064 RepID=A0ABW5KUG5_9FLAO
MKLFVNGKFWLFGLLILAYSCADLTAEAEEKLLQLNKKTDSLNALITEELDKVKALDTLINFESNKVQKLDSLVTEAATKIDSLAQKSLDGLNGVLK